MTVSKMKMEVLEVSRGKEQEGGRGKATSRASRAPVQLRTEYFVRATIT